SGVEELLEEFRQQLQQEQSYKLGGVADSCVGDFSSVGDSIIQAKASIEQGATFLLAPKRVYTWRDCVHACCSQPHCTVAVIQEEQGLPGADLDCYLFNCTYRGQHVCSFAPQPGFSAYSREANTSPLSPGAGVDEPPRSDAGQDVVIQLPTDWAVLDGRDSVDDRGIAHYAWTLVRGDTAISMKVPHPGLLKLGQLQEGVYTFKLTVTDTRGQKSSDDVSVTVLPPKHQAEVCSGRCSSYQFKCDDGCCIDITYACDGKQHCPDRSDEDFCSDFDGGRKSVTHPAAGDGSTLQAGAGRAAGAPEVCVDTRAGPAFKPASAAPPVTRQTETGKDQHSNVLTLDGGQTSLHSSSPASRGHAGSQAPVSKPAPAMGGHPAPETAGAVLPLALGLIITALLLLMISCRLRLVRHKLKKARPLSTEESDYLINGMYL
uniref:Low density lipoprotein receptor-related protein 11 n=1 Tax=Tetraodon nigroviridis TaxID=99883 RepID=H3C9I2_TETNG